MSEHRQRRERERAEHHRLIVDAALEFAAENTERRLKLLVNAIVSGGT
ncbi:MULTISPECIES: hypothetical protein [Streptomyces]|nr:hypothetical protein [Streptomyces venezuelae]